MDEYISKKKVLDYLKGYFYALGTGGADDLSFNRGQRRALINAIQDISAAKAEDVQPLSVIAEHIKNRLYETAFNTTEETASRSISDMAERIDFWIDELKGGEENG